MTNRQYNQLEANAISETAASALPGSINIDTNFVPLLISSKKLFQYTTSFEFLENATDMKGDHWKLELQQRLLNDMFKGLREQMHVRDSCLCLGQFILSPVELPSTPFQKEYELHEKVDRRVEKRVYRISITEAEAFDLSQNPNMFVLNNIVDAAFRVVFPHKVGPKLIDLSQQESQDGIVIVKGVIPTATTTVLGNELRHVVQVSPAIRVVSNQTCFQACAAVTKTASGPERTRQKILERFFKKKVCTMYQTREGVKGMTYRVLDVVLDVKANDTFGCRSDPTMTYKRYFAERYNINLIDDQPYFKCKGTTGSRCRASLIPSQVLYAMELDDSQKSKLPQLCSIYPNDRMTRIHDILTRLKTVESGRALQVLESYGLGLGESTLRATGRVIRPIEVLVPSGPSFRSVNTGSAENQQQLGFAKHLGSLRLNAPRKGYDVLHLVEQRDEGARAPGVREIDGTLNAMNSNVRINSIKPVYVPSGNMFAAANQLVSSTSTAQAENTLVIASLHMKETGPYKDVKTALIGKGIMSQVIAQSHNKNLVFKMIAQQISAKGGSLNWVVDLARVCPSLSKKGKVLIIGCDVATGNKFIETERNCQRMDVHVVACVAFCVDIATKEWHHYCNHYVGFGAKEKLPSFGDDVETATSASTESVRMTSAAAMEKFVPQFVQEAVSHFGNVSGVIIARGSASDGEIAAAKMREVDALQQILSDTPFTHLAAQRRNNTKLSWKAKECIARLPDQYVNAPRGFTTSEGIPTLLTKEPAEAQRGFYVNGANCTLGHAKQTKFNILHDGRVCDELPELMYALSFMFPNKPDGLPYPLPLKCADKYANLMVTLDINEIRTLPTSLRTRIHYI